MRNKSCSGTGKEGKTKEVVEDRKVNKVVCEELCVIKLCAKDVCDTITVHATLIVSNFCSGGLFPR